MSWEDIIADEDFQAQPSSVKMDVARNYFNKHIATDEDFKAEPKESQDTILSNFLDTVRPKGEDGKKIESDYNRKSLIEGAIIDLRKFPGGRFIADAIGGIPQDVEDIKKGVEIIKEKPSEAFKAFPGSINRLLGDVAAVGAGFVGGATGFVAGAGIELGRLINKPMQTPEEQKQTEELTNTWKEQINTFYGLTDKIGSEASQKATEMLFLPATIPIEAKNKMIDETSLSDTSKEWLKLGGDVAFIAGGGHVIEKKVKEALSTGNYKSKSEAMDYVKEDLNEASVAREGLNTLSKSGDTETKVMSKIALESGDPDVMKSQIKDLLQRAAESAKPDAAQKATEAMKKTREAQIKNDAELLSQQIDAAMGIGKQGKAADASAEAMRQGLESKERAAAARSIAGEKDLAAGEVPSYDQTLTRKKQLEEMYKENPLEPLDFAGKLHRESSLRDADRAIENAKARDDFNSAAKSAKVFIDNPIDAKALEAKALAKHAKDMGKTYLATKQSIEELSELKKNKEIDKQEKLRIQEMIDQGKSYAFDLSKMMEETDKLLEEKKPKEEKKGDTKNIQGVSGEVEQGKEPVKTEPVGAGGKTQIAAGGDVQAHEKEGNAKVTPAKETLKVTDIPEGMEVDTVTSYTAKGKEIRGKRNAREALSEKLADIDTFNGILNCMKGK